MQPAYTFKPIGLIRSPFTDREGMPIQAVRSDAPGRVEMDGAYVKGLLDIEGFSHLILLYVFHRIEEPELIIRPFLDDQPHGVFATRHPARPNPIGLSVVELIEHDGNVLYIRGVDVLDSTPLLDIKPYVPQFDHHTVTRTGWLKGQEDRRPWQSHYK
ncbi:MAG: tRNA (N6-threonylcarbamoyladenosine(37)-N6)-methyltransferase TrmO [Anaerolineae bacterium]